MALKWLRDNLRHLKFILWGVVAVFVLLVFVDWGSGRSGGSGGSGAAVRIGSRSVSEGEFLSEMRRLDQRFSQIYGEQWQQIRDQIDLPGQTANYFIDRELRLQEARRAGITVSEQELREAILADPSFTRESGEFVGAETYERMIRAYFRMTPQEFEARFAEDLIVGKLNSLVERGVWVSDAEVEEEYRKQHELADIDTIQLRYERHLSDVVLSEDEIRAAFASTAEDYRRDEQRVIRYLSVEVPRLRRLLDVAEDELKAYYDAHKEDFVEGEQAHARHILIRVAPDATAAQQADAELHAEGVAKIAASGADFAELAAKHSDDPGSKDNGGDLGWFARGRMVPEFEEAVFSAKPGDIVGPVKSQFGYHIIRVEGFRPEHQLPFEDVREQVRFRVVEGRASAEAEARAAALAKRLESESPETLDEWQAIADEDEAVVLNQSTPFGADDTIAGLSQDSELAAEAFSARLGEIHGPRPVTQGWIVWQLDEIKPAGVPPFDEVRPQVEQILRQEKATALTIEEANGLAERWRGGENAGDLAEEYGSTVVETRDHRRDTPIDTFGVVPAVDSAVFSAAVGTVLDPVRVGANGVVVARVVDLTLIDPAELERERETMRSRLISDRANQLLRAILNERRRETVITIDTELMERFAPASS